MRAGELRSGKCTPVWVCPHSRGPSVVLAGARISRPPHGTAPCPPPLPDTEIHYKTSLKKGTYLGALLATRSAKRRIVANLPSKTTPKWSPKWRQIEKGRPSRNIGRHCPNTYFALSWELRFRCFFGVCKKVTKKLIQKDRFRNLVPKVPKMASQRGGPG